MTNFSEFTELSPFIGWESCEGGWFLIAYLEGTEFGLVLAELGCRAN